MEHDPERDELTLLAAARPEPTPDPGTVDAHRKALTAAMERQRPAANWRRIAVAAAVLPLAAAAAVLFTDAPDKTAESTDAPESTEATDAPELQLASSHAFYGAPRCGTDPPPDLTIPEGFTGPTEGPSPDALRPAEADQLARHWTKGTATIELRWYADPEAIPPGVSDLEPGELHQVESMDGGDLPSGRFYFEDTWTSAPGELDDPCSWVQLWVFDEDRALAVGTFNQLGRGCFPVSTVPPSNPDEPSC